MDFFLNYNHYCTGQRRWINFAFAFSQHPPAGWSLIWLASQHGQTIVFFYNKVLTVQIEFAIASIPAAILFSGSEWSPVVPQIPQHAFQAMLGLDFRILIILALVLALILTVALVLANPSTCPGPNPSPNPNPHPGPNPSPSTRKGCGSILDMYRGSNSLAARACH